MKEDLNRVWNDFISDRADGDAGYEKRVPYIGWFWRDVDFDGDISIGNCGEFVGFMENNKWDYPERHLTDDERLQVRAIVEAAMQLHEDGDEDGANAKLAELFPLLQTFTIETAGFWIFGPGTPTPRRTPTRSSLSNHIEVNVKP